MKNEKIIIIGYGWVGQANALSLTRLGYRVFYYDIVEPVKRYTDKYQELYRHVKYLDDMLSEDAPTTRYLVCVGDKVEEDGRQNLSLIEHALESLKPAKGTVILRSTVLPQHLKNLDFDFYMPEFLHEKLAVEEVFNPFYFILGSRNPKIPEPEFLETLEMRAKKVFKGTPEEAAYIKYLSNVWNALRIAFVNEFGNIVETPVDEERQKKVEKIIDFVFEKKSYLRYGRSFGGHCLPKDLLALWSINKDKNIPILKAAFESNLVQKELEKKYRHLPEWFSKWDYGDGEVLTTASALRSLLSRHWVMRAARRNLKPVVRFLEGIIPEKTLKDTKKIWNDLAKNNARYFVYTKTKTDKSVDEFELRESGFADYEKYIKKDEFLISQLGLLKDKKVLDIGCGIGRMTEFFTKDFNEVCGIDISEEMILNAKKRLVGFGNVSMMTNDGVIYPFSDNSFDFAFSYLVFQHIPQISDIERNFMEISRILKKGGITKIQLRTGPSLWKWQWSYGVSVGLGAAKTIAGKAGLKLLKSEVEGIKNLWLWLEK